MKIAAVESILLNVPYRTGSGVKANIVKGA
jgi:hypothetical protein